jgi:hypothetical protein
VDTHDIHAGILAFHADIHDDILAFHEDILGRIPSDDFLGENIFVDQGELFHGQQQRLN